MTLMPSTQSPLKLSLILMKPVMKPGQRLSHLLSGRRQSLAGPRAAVQQR